MTARPRLRAIAIAVGLMVFAGVAVTGCTDQPDKPRETRVPKPEATFTATINREPDALRIEYRLRNSGPVPVVTYDRVPRTDSASKVDATADAVYVTVRADQTVEIAKRTFEIPKDANVYAPMLIGGTILRPGEEVTGRTRVPLPLTPRHPYQSILRRPVRIPAAVRTVLFCLGASRQDALPEGFRSGVSPPSSDSGPGPLFTHPSSQHLFCSEPYDLAR